MALSEDSRTLLQLLLGRGKSYSDISGLLGIEESEVRDRAHQALTEINGSDPDRDVNLTDYLLGQSDPIGRADIARELADNPEAAETASDLSDQLRLLVPGADLPRVAGGKVTPSKRGLTSRPASPKTPSAKTEGSSGPGRSLTGTQRRNIALALGAALIAVVVILALAGTFSGDGDDSGGDSADDSADASLITSVLTPVKNQSGDGQVQFGFSGTDFAANLQFEDLAPTPDSKTYVLWLSGSSGAFPIHQTAVDESGSFGGQKPITPAILCALAADTFPEMKLSLVDDTELKNVLSQVQRAVKRGAGKFPEFTGKPVLEGGVSMSQSDKEKVLPSCAPAAAS